MSDLADFVKGRVDKETLDRIAKRADELQRLNLTDKDKDRLALNYIPEHRMAKLIVEYLSAEDKEIAEKAAKLIVRDYGEVLKKLEEEE